MYVHIPFVDAALRLPAYIAEERRLNGEVERLREALKHYAERDNWEPPGGCMMHGHFTYEIAAAALDGVLVEQWESSNPQDSNDG